MNPLPDSPIDLSPIIARYFPNAKAPMARKVVADEDKSFFQRVNDHAMADFASWVLELFPSAEQARTGYRVRSVNLGRALEEDISIQPEGIVDFGVADQGDENEGKRTPLALVLEWREDLTTATEAAMWLCNALGVNPADLGWRDTPDLPIDPATEFDTLDDGADDSLPGFERDKKGKILNSIENACKAVAAPHFMGWRVGYDAFRDATMMAPTGTEEWRTLQDADYTELRILMEQRDFKPVAKELVRDAVEYVGARQTFDSAILWLESLKWDGVPRIEKFLAHYFSAGDSRYVRAVSLYLWTALAGRVLAPGVKADMMPILVGAQGSRKSTGVAAIVPDIEQFCEVDLSAKEDDLARRMRGLLVAEIGELRGLHSREIEHIKAFISRTHEKWVPKFKEFATQFPRRCIFVGTTNKNEFLADETGERRFLPITVGRVMVEQIREDRLQLWAEAAHQFRQGGVVWAMAEELARDVHDAHKLIDPWTVAIESWLDAVPEFSDEEVDPLRNGERPFTMSKLLKEALGFDDKHMAAAHDKRAGAILKPLGYYSTPRRINGALVRAWVKEPVIKTQSP